MAHKQKVDQFRFLFTHGKLGPVELRNRIVFLPHYHGIQTDDGTLNDNHINYYVERAKGGAGLLIVGNYFVHLHGKAAANNIEAWDRRVIPGYRKLSREVHRYGAKIFVQLNHAGHTTLALPPRLLLAPSQMSEPGYHYNTKEMEPEDIEETIEGFARSARLVREGGFDGVEIKGAAHDGLLRSFISSYFNRREDEYGGSFENRMRLPLEVVHAVREAVGGDFVFGVRVCMDEFTPWGYGPEEGKRIVEAFVGTGEIDYISADAGCFSSFYMEIPPTCIPPGFAEYLSVEIKKVTDLPVIAFGRINDPVQAERILENQSEDFIGMARELICDPEFANKAKEGREEEIRHCVACQDGCIYQVMQDKPIRCIQNPAVGREAEYGIGSLEAAAEAKGVLVVGGGPAGLKVAETAAMRGHRVVLYEREEELGGQVNIAARIPCREEIKEVVRHLVVRVERLGVEVHLGEELTAEAIEGMESDVVVIATGSYPASGEVPGSEEGSVVSVWDVLLDRVETGEHVVIYDSTRRWPGLGTAEYLAERGRRVEVVTPAMYVGQQLEPSNISLAYGRIMEKGVLLRPHTELLRIEKTAVITFNVYTLAEERIEGVDTVVMSVGNVSRRGLYDSLKGKLKELYCVGDAVAPRLIEQAIYEAENIGRKL
jgi:mycofactocin system FadH/OYE family oxidoreductase 2